MRELKGHGAVLRRMIDCENLLAVLEGIFYRMCCARGKPLDAVANALPVHLGEIRKAQARLLRVLPPMSRIERWEQRGPLARDDRHIQRHESRALRVVGYTTQYAKNANAQSGCGKSKGAALRSDVDVAEPGEADLEGWCPVA